MIGVGVDDLVSWSQVNFTWRLSHGPRNDINKLIDGIKMICADIEYLVVRDPVCDRSRNSRRDITDVTKSTRLIPISENRHRFPLHHLIHKNPDNIAIFVAKVLFFPVNIVRTEDYII